MDTPATSAKPLPKWGNSMVLSSEFPVSFGRQNNISRRKYSENVTMTIEDTAKLNDSVLKQFNKKFSFDRNTNWDLPHVDSLFQEEPFTIQELQKLKKILNDTKEKLNDKNLDEWHKHTRMTNTAGDVLQTIRKRIKPEFTTQAWMKFFESVSSYDLIPLDCINKKLNSVHLCEAPGAFITSLNHYIQLYGGNLEWDWIGTTLNPHYEGTPLSFMINDDRFILKTLKHWTFLKDNTGDLMSLDNLRSLLVRIQQRMDGTVNLFTADGSIDCQEEPAEQETYVGALHYCEAFAATLLLAKGGSFLLKMFTFFECHTVCLMYYLCSVFNQVHVFKPATSKEGNSEVYVACLDFKGDIKPWLTKMKEFYGPTLPSKSLFPLSSIPKGFIEQLISCATLFKDFQVDVIERNISLFQQRMSYEQRGFIRELRLQVANTFITKYRLVELDQRRQNIVRAVQLGMVQMKNMDPRVEYGTFNDKLERVSLSTEDQLKLLRNDLRRLMSEIHVFRDTRIKSLKERPEKLSVKPGRPITYVESSKFCIGRLLKLKSQLRVLLLEIMNINEQKKTAIQIKKSTDSSNRDDTDTESRGIKRPLSRSGELEEILASNIQSTLSSSKDNPLSQWKKDDCIILDFSRDGIDELLENQEETKRENFTELMEALDNSKRGSSILLWDWPMLTRFHVGVVYLVSRMFSEVYFLKLSEGYGILFYDFDECHDIMENLGLILYPGLTEENPIVETVPVTSLCEEPWYTTVLNYNHGRESDIIRSVLRCLEDAHRFNL